MSSFLIRRMAFVLVSLIGATAIVFALSRMAGDPILLYAKPYGYGDTEEYLNNLRAHLGLDQPLVVQYVKWVWQLAQGDLGLTLLSRRPVIDVIGEKIWNTFQLAFTGWLFATILGVPLGVLSAVKRGTYWDYLGRGFALFGQALPAFLGRRDAGAGLLSNMGDAAHRVQSSTQRARMIMCIGIPGDSIRNTSSCLP